MEVTSDEQWDQAATIALEQLGRLMASWDDHVSGHDGDLGFELGRRGKKLEWDTAAVVLGLAAHCHELARVVVAMEGTAAAWTLVPTVRTMMESAVAANWVLKNEEGARAFAHRAADERRLAADDMGAMKGAVWKGASGRVKQRPDLLRKSSSTAVARNFKRMCHDIEDVGPEIYLVYRALSWYAHPGMPVAGLYFREIGARPGIAFTGVQPSAHGHALLLTTAARAVLWAGGAVDSMDRQGRVRGPVLREAGRALSTRPVLNLTMQASSRIRQSLRQRASKA